MNKKILTALVICLVVLVLLNAGILGFVWYRNNHVFVEGKAYPIRARALDLREEEISLDHYNTLHALLPLCDVSWNVPFQGGRYPNDSAELTIRDPSEDDIALLRDYFPSLRRVDATACTDYSMLELLAHSLPEAQIVYTVSLGQTAFGPDATSLTLTPQDYDYETLIANLPHLPLVDSIVLKTPQISLEQLNTLKETFPDVRIDCTVELLGQEVSADTTELNLAGITSTDVPALLERLPMLSSLETVELADENGECSLAPEEVQELIAAAPAVQFHYEFEFYGQRLSTTDTEEVRVYGKKIGDAGEPEIRRALDLMQNCRRFVLENCSVSNDVMAQIREDYRDKTKVVWRVYFGEGSTMTDAEVIRAVYNLTDDNSGNLRYCEDARYMDIGHNEYLDGADFVSGMTSLEVVIISGAPIKSLAPFANCKNLRILEASDCGYIEDISPLAECTSLEMLNICYTKVTDLSPLDELNITHMHAKGRYTALIPAEEQARFEEVHPDCASYFNVDGQPYGIGWRYIDKETKMDWYEDIKVAFRYPDAPNHVGWYLDK